MSIKDRFIVVSGADSYRIDAHINHERYCNKNNYNYRFNLKTDLQIPYFIKCHTILDAFRDYEYVLWIDDDAFFINEDWDCTEVFNKYPQDIIVTRGRPKKSGITLFNNGIIFARNTEKTNLLFKRMMEVTNQELRDNYKKQWGPMDLLDQSRMIYLTETEITGITKILDYPGFNAHEVTFKDPKFLKTSPPIVHITGKEKQGKIDRFVRSTGIKLP